MPRRYLFGPVSAAFAVGNLGELREAGSCRTFNQGGDADLRIAVDDTWEAVCARLPAEWQPDFLVLNLDYQTIPPGLWQAPVPLIALAPDWNWLFHAFRRTLPLCDLAFTDTNGVDVLRRSGCPRVFPANLFGLERAYLDAPPAKGERPIDVIFVGNLHPAVQRERLAWLGRLARLGERHRVVIRTGVYGDDYRALLRRSRIVFNRSARGECNLRVLEAAASGALLFQERENVEVGAYFRDRQECVFYGEDNLETLLEYYLSHEDERRTVAEAGRQRACQLPYAFFWKQVLERIEQEWPALQERARQRAYRPHETLLARAEQFLSSRDRADQHLLSELTAAAAMCPEEAAYHNLLGLVTAAAGMVKSAVTVPLMEAALSYFQRALSADPTHVFAALNEVETLVVIGQSQLAIERARHALTLLDGAIVERLLAQLDAPHFPPIFDIFRVEWERAAWNNAGERSKEVRAKATLLRWRLHTLLAELTGDLVHFHEAAVARPDLPRSRATLGCALARARRPAEAVSHLRAAVEANPFDSSVARALHQALKDRGDDRGASHFANSYRIVAGTTGGLLKPEAWFANALPQAVACYRLVDDSTLRTSEPIAQVATSPTCISLCLIVKNEEKNLPACLEQVTDLVDEIVVVDTGSTDTTREVATRYGAKVVSFPWVDSFAAARNEGLRHATGTWILWLDADDRLDADNRDKLRALLTNLPEENVAYAMKCLCFQSEPGGMTTVVDHLRLFRNDPLVRWEHRVHEQIFPSIQRSRGVVRWSDITIHHIGYQDAAVRAHKRARNLRLLELERAEQPDHPFTLFNLGTAYYELRHYAKALGFLRRSLALSERSASTVRKLYTLIVSCHHAQGELAEALAACREGRHVYPDDLELLFAEALLHRDRKDLNGAVACLTRLLEVRPAPHFGSVDIDLRDQKARYELGGLYQQLGRLPEAETQWRAVVTKRPDFAPGWVALGQLYLQQQRWSELDETAQRLEATPTGCVDAAVLRSHRDLEQGRVAAARRRLEYISTAHPPAVGPRVLLSRILLQDDRDLSGAEKVLREILALQPNHAEAGNNLGVLLRRRQNGSAPQSDKTVSLATTA